MRKIFLTLTLILTLFTATAFAAEDENQFYEYTSETYGFKIDCPLKPVVVVKPFEDPNKNGELLVFANEGMKVLYGYIIELDAFEDMKIPDFNRDKKKIIDAYIDKMRADAFYNSVEIREISPKNKGLVMVTAKEIEILGENNEVKEKITAEEQRVITYFRSRSGRCISIQLIDVELDDNDYNIYRKSVSTYQDATDLSMPSENDNSKKSKKKKK